MSLPLASLWPLLSCLLSVDPAPHRVSIDLATLHAAALTTSRGAADTTDSPYFLVSVIAPRAGANLHLPATGHWRIAEDAVVSPTPVAALELAPGDTARVVISVLESETTEPASEVGAGAASGAAVGRLVHPLVDSVGGALVGALDGLIRGGAHWLGSVSLLLTNEDGMLWWRRMDCVRECAVTKGLPEGSGGVALTKPTSGVFELSGGAGTYHMQLRLKQLD